MKSNRTASPGLGGVGSVRKSNRLELGHVASSARRSTGILSVPGCAAEDKLHHVSETSGCPVEICDVDSVS